MTPDGFARLEDELKFLKGTARPDVIRAIGEAREHGDLSENAGRQRAMYSAPSGSYNFV